MSDELCRESCQHSYWQSDPVFGGGQYNCPWKFGVTFARAVYNGKRLCKHYTKVNDKQVHAERLRGEGDGE